MMIRMMMRKRCINGRGRPIVGKRRDERRKRRSILGRRKIVGRRRIDWSWRRRRRKQDWLLLQRLWNERRNGRRFLGLMQSWQMEMTKTRP